MATSFKKSCACTAALSAPNPAADHHQPTPLPEPPGHSHVSLGQPLLGSLLLSPGSWCTQGFVCALQASVSPVLCKFLGLYGGVNANLLQEGLYHTQVCCTQNTCPCVRSLPTLSPQETQTLKGRSGSAPVGFPGARKVLCEPSECLWWIWGLILNAISPLLPSCWGVSFALGHGVSYFGGIQHFPLNGCAAASCNFRVLTGEDECTSFYFATLTYMPKTLNVYSKIVVGSQVIFILSNRTNIGHLTKEVYNLGIKVKEEVVFFLRFKQRSPHT